LLVATVVSSSKTTLLPETWETAPFMAVLVVLPEATVTRLRVADGLAVPSIQAGTPIH
jgi:hypothetical protein